MKRQRAGMDAEEDFSTYHFNTSIVEVEHIVRRGGFRFNSCLVVEAIRDREVG